MVVLQLAVGGCGQKLAVTVNPVFTKQDGPERWMIGVLPMPKLKIETSRLSLPAALRESVEQNIKGASLIYQFLSGIVQRRMSPKSIEGPIRIAQLSGDAAREGPTAFIMLMAMVSLNLAIFNLLPIPILDGGVIMLLFVESLMRRDISMPIKERIYQAAFVFLVLFAVMVIYNDLVKTLPGVMQRLP